MAVYTVLNAKELSALVEQFQLGSLLEFSGIAGGMENSNYLLTCQRDGELAQDYVLTIFEELGSKELPFHLNLLRQLDAVDIPVAAPIATSAGQFQCAFLGKPLIICPRLPGIHPDTTSITQCQAIASAMAQFHQYCLQVNMQHKGIRSHDWLEQLVTMASPLLSTEDATAVALTLAQFKQLNSQNLPIGLTHSDLFRDNALFDGDKLSGIIDFYSASEAYLLLDVAILINDWCRNGGHIDKQKLGSVIAAYNEYRALTQQEYDAMDLMLKVAAMRFWLSRVLEQQKEGQKSLGIKKAPEEFRRLFYKS